MQYNAPDFEIPTSVREIAGKSVDQAKDAYTRFIDAARQAQDMVSKSTEVFTSGAKEVNEKVLEFTEANTKNSFEVAARLAKARDIKEVMEIQTQFARTQIEAYTQQAQELSRILAVSAQKAQPNQAA
ncbi:MAG: phasin family protein [Alphaproteobacteria bacterium]|jgi:phasin